MKKLYVLLALAMGTLAAHAQLTLTGSSYTQNFDNISGTLPAEWAGYTGATSSSLGTMYTYSSNAKFGAFYDTTNCASSVFGKGFKDCASADAAIDTSTCAEQQLVSNRAFGVRQTSSTGYDPGVAFVLHIANTTGFSGFVMGFKLQGLDIRSPRQTTWTVDYGFGATPTTFTPITPTVGYMVTGGSKFTDTAVAVNFGTALDNQAQDVWIRIVSLSATSGSGNRTTSAIDDFVLSYTPTSVATIESKQITFKVLGTATTDNATFACNVAKAGQYTLAMYDLMGRSVYSKTITLTPGGQNTVVANGMHIAPGMYIAHITNGSVAGIAKVMIQ